MSQPWGDRQGEFIAPGPTPGQTPGQVPAPTPWTGAPPSSAEQPYPTQPYAAQPDPVQPYPVQPNSAQPYPAQPYPAQPYPAQPYPAQPYPAQPYLAQPNSVQPNSVQPYPAQPNSAQPYSVQPYSGQPYSPVPIAGGDLVSVGGRFGAFLLDGLLIVVTLGIGYLIWALITWSDGQTPGKKLLGHVVADAQTGVPLDWGRMALRQFVIQGLLGGLLSGISLGIYFWVDAFMVFGERQRTLHDRMANSVVRHV